MDFQLKFSEYLDQINPDFERKSIRVYKPLLQQIADLVYQNELIAEGNNEQ